MNINLLEALSFGFMQRALLGGILVAIICALIGVFLVLRRLSLIGDGLAHITFGGVALGLFLHWNPLITALGFSIASAFAITKLRTQTKLYGETAIAILFSSGLALGVILLSLSKGFNIDLFSFLFGNILAVTFSDLITIFCLGVVVVLSILFFYKEFFAITFDEETALASGIPTEKLNLFFTILTAITVVLSIRIVGILLVSSLIVLPCATSLQIARSFKQTLFLSVALAVLSVIIGLFCAYIFDIAPGGSIVFALILFFLLSICIKKIR